MERESGAEKTRPAMPVRGRTGWVTPLLLIGALLVHALFWVSLHTGSLDPLFNDATHRLPRGFDFFAVYQKSHEREIGRPLYAPVAADAMVVPYSAPYYRYLPSWAWVFSHTLGRLPPQVAYWLWLAACELMALACVVALGARTRSRAVRAGLAGMWLAFTPYYLELFVGQFTFMTAGFLTLALCAFEARREWLAAGLLLSSVAIKYVGLVLLAPLLAAGRVRVVAAVAVAVAAICVLYFVPHPRELPLMLGVAGTGTPNLLHAGNLGLSGLTGALARLIPVAAPLLLVLVPAGVVGTSLYATWRHRGDADLVPLCLLWLSSYFLVGPDVYEHHYVLLLPVLSFALIRSPTRVVWVLYALLALPTAFWWVDLPGLPHQRFVEVENLWWSHEMYGRILIHHAWKALPAVALYGWQLDQLRSRGGRDLAEATPLPAGAA